MRLRTMATPLDIVKMISDARQGRASSLSKKAFIFHEALTWITYKLGGTEQFMPAKLKVMSGRSVTSQLTVHMPADEMYCAPGISCRRNFQYNV